MPIIGHKQAQRMSFRVVMGDHRAEFLSGMYEYIVENLIETVVQRLKQRGFNVDVSRQGFYTR